MLLLPASVLCMLLATKRKQNYIVAISYCSNRLEVAGPSCCYFLPVCCVCFLQLGESRTLLLLSAAQCWWDCSSAHGCMFESNRLMPFYKEFACKIVRVKYENTFFPYVLSLVH